MKFALVDNKRCEAEKGLMGSCPTCGQAMIAKCGDRIIHHWSHKGKLECDPWWESETEWHRAWKNRFNNEWQEISHTDLSTGEIHRADVKTPKQLVIEFQNSPIKHEERKSREDFYQNMVWVVNGTRRTKDHERFTSETEWLAHIDGNANELVTEKDCFKSPLLKEWCDSKVPVIIDFNEPFFWSIMPKYNGRRYFFKTNTKYLLDSLTKDEFETLKNRWQNSIDKNEWHIRRVKELRGDPLLSMRRNRR